jgi:hypothetical protein
MQRRNCALERSCNLGVEFEFNRWRHGKELELCSMIQESSIIQNGLRA